MQSSKIKEQDGDVYDPKKLEKELQNLMNDKVIRLFDEYAERKKKESDQEALVAALKKNESKKKKDQKE